MKRILMVLGIVLGAYVASADDSYLWWMVDSETNDKYNYVYAVVKAKSASGEAQQVEGEVLFKGGGQMWTNIGSLGSAYSYYIELFGEAEGGGYEAVAASSLASWGKLQDFLTKSSNVPTSPWKGGEFHAVPEPTSGLLLLLGMAGLALRRKRA